MSEKVITQLDTSSWISKTFRISPNNKRVSYVIEVDEGLSVLLDGQVGKSYNDIKQSPAFSPDSRHLAYAAAIGKDMFVVVDGKEGDYYNNIITLGGGRVAFDSPDSLHYLALRAKDIYLVEEMV